MEEQSKIIWEFLEAAFRTGTLDELLQFVNVLAGKNFEDMSQLFADLEDVFIEMENTKNLEENFGKIYLILKELTNEDLLEGIRVLLSLINPLVESVIEKGGGDSPLSSEKQAELRSKMIQSARTVMHLASMALKMYIASV